MAFRMLPPQRGVLRMRQPQSMVKLEFCRDDTRSYHAVRVIELSVGKTAISVEVRLTRMKAQFPDGDSTYRR
jgi:hypothetical protein